jgi:hypothetical protein
MIIKCSRNNPRIFSHNAVFSAQVIGVLRERIMAAEKYQWFAEKCQTVTSASKIINAASNSYSPFQQ